MQIFVIGNGTSLKPEQLDLIKGKPSIACNRISLMYPFTEWRPTIYIHPESFAVDLDYIKQHIDMGIECWIGERYAPPPRGEFDIQDAPNVHWLKECHHWYLNFDSEEALDEWHLPQPCSFGGSVNVAMQIAVLKGYDEIVLLGCDLLYKTRNRSHFSPDYEHGKERPPFQAAKNAFFGHVQALNWIRRKQPNIKVYNATEGGMLELWERVKLQDVIQ